jgi:hypothetical protein
MAKDYGTELFTAKTGWTVDVYDRAAPDKTLFHAWRRDRVAAKLAAQVWIEAHAEDEDTLRDELIVAIYQHDPTLLSGAYGLTMATELADALMTRFDVRKREQ